MSNDLVTLDEATKLTAVELFKPEKVSDILDKIKKEARSVVIDISTESGRKECASVAYKIARSKTALDSMGKDLVEGWKTQAKAIDAERKRIRDELDALKDEIRAPLTELENKEKEHEAALVTLSTLSRLEGDETLEQIKDRMSGEEKYFTGRDWELFSARATAQHEKNVQILKEAHDRRKKYDDDQAELERLRKEREERERQEREERIAKEAAAKAKIEAEERAAREKAVAEAKAKAEQDRLEREKREASERAEAAEKARISAEEKAKADAKAAAEKAKADKQAAVDAERFRIEAEKKAEYEAAAKREADKAHKAKVNNDAVNSLVRFASLTEEQARQVVTAIAKSEISNVKIFY